MSAGTPDPNAEMSVAAIRQRAPFAYGQWKADLEWLLAALAAAAQANRSCAVCHTSSWAPTPDGEHCAYCALVQALRATAAACAEAETAAVAALDP